MSKLGTVGKPPTQFRLQELERGKGELCITRDLDVATKRDAGTVFIPSQTTPMPKTTSHALWGVSCALRSQQ